MSGKKVIVKLAVSTATIAALTGCGAKVPVTTDGMGPPPDNANKGIIATVCPGLGDLENLQQLQEQVKPVSAGDVAYGVFNTFLTYTYPAIKAAQLAVNTVYDLGKICDWWEPISLKKSEDKTAEFKNEITPTRPQATGGKAPTLALKK